MQPTCKTCGQKGPHKCFGLISAMPEKPISNSTVGICSVCKTINSEHQQCNCANKKLIPLTPVELPTRSEDKLIGPKYDEGKLQYSLIPPIATKALAEVLTFGAKKYAPNSWQNVPDAERRYLDALMRHLEAYRAGEETDQESKLSHLAHLLCNASFLLYFQQDKLSTISNEKKKVIKEMLKWSSSTPTTESQVDRCYAALTNTNQEQECK